MSGRIKLTMPVVVEGRYDKIKLLSVIDGIIITTDGFGIYKNKAKQALIRKYAETTGIIILTDSDGDILREAFEKAGVTGPGPERSLWADKQMLVKDGLSGGNNSSELRKKLCMKLGLPERMTAKALLEALNTLLSEEEYAAALEAVKKGD